jgi:hypothetical protein
VFDGLEQTRGGPDPRVLLSRAGEPVLTDSGSPFDVWLTRAQFAALQDWWEAFGLPRDLGYSPADEPEYDDALFRPGAVTVEELAARKQRLVDACGRLLQALSVRDLQLGGQWMKLPDALLHAPVLATRAAEYRVVQDLSAALGRATLALARLANAWAPLPPEPAEDPLPPPA